MTNRRTWLYRLTPSVKQGGYKPSRVKNQLTADFDLVDPSPRRWSPAKPASRHVSAISFHVVKHDDT